MKSQKQIILIYTMVLLSHPSHIKSTQQQYFSAWESCHVTCLIVCSCDCQNYRKKLSHSIIMGNRVKMFDYYFIKQTILARRQQMHVAFITTHSTFIISLLLFNRSLSLWNIKNIHKFAHKVPRVQSAVFKSLIFFDQQVEKYSFNSYITQTSTPVEKLQPANW